MLNTAKLLIQSFCIDFQGHVFYLFPNMMLTNTKGTRLTTKKPHNIPFDLQHPSGNQPYLN